MAAAVALRPPWRPPPAGAASYDNQPTCCETSLSLKLENVIVFAISYELVKGMAHRVDVPCLRFLVAIRWHDDSSRT